MCQECVNKIQDVRDQIQVGDVVLTNGDGADRIIPDYIEGVVAFVGKKFFYIVHSNPNYVGNPTPKVAPAEWDEKYVWCVGLNNPGKIRRIKSTTNQTASPLVGEEDTVEVSVAVSQTIIQEPKQNMNFLQKVSNEIKKLLNADTKVLLEAGFRDEQLRLTKAGRFALLEIQSQGKYGEEAVAALVAEAKEVIAERKAAEERE